MLRYFLFLIVCIVIAASSYRPYRDFALQPRVSESLESAVKFARRSASAKPQSESLPVQMDEIADLESEVASGTTDAEAYVDLANHYDLQLADGAGAAEILERGISLGSANEETYARYAELAEMNRISKDRAERFLIKHLGQHDKDAPARLALVEVLLDQEDLPNASRHLEFLASRKNLSASFRFRLGLAQSAVGRTAEAEALLSSLTDDPIYRAHAQRWIDRHSAGDGEE